MLRRLGKLLRRRVLRPVRARHWGCRTLSSDRGSRTGLDVIYDRIKAAGPVTVADYMRECLLHPAFGYYMQSDVFGAKGDFTTSPEISQVFGELLAVWVVAEWMGAGEPGHCQLVELGPGRGTLAKDMLRVFAQFESFLKAVSLHLVEASPHLSTLQEDTLRGQLAKGSGVLSDSQSQTAAEAVSSSIPYKSCRLDPGPQVSWYQRIEDVPKGYSYYIAHEFFDALPVHHFQRTPSGLREVLVDLDPGSSKKALRFVVAPGPTPASVGYASFLPLGEGQWVELCPEGMVVAKELAARVRDHGGVALVGDYGEEEGGHKHTLRGFRQHQLHDVLAQPGTTDLTADVNFGTIRRSVSSEGASCHGPMTQTEFLHRMGIRQRIAVLLQKASPSQARDLLSSYKMLTGPEEMGERFKFMAITALDKHIPTPFSE